MAVNLADLKAEVRVLHDHEDSLLARKLAAAQIFVESRIGRKFDDFEDGVPAALDEAVLKIAAHLYEFRGVASEKALTAIPEGLTALINIYRRWTIHSTGCRSDGA